MCLFRRRKQDRIARDIAASHDMLPDYRAARRYKTLFRPPPRRGQGN